MLKHYRLNPLEIIERLGLSYRIPEWVTYDKSINKDFDYKIKRTSIHDRTMAFHYELLWQVLFTICNRTSYDKRFGWLSDIEYIIGDIHVGIVYGKVELPCGIVNGEKELIYLPVKIKEKING